MASKENIQAMLEKLIGNRNVYFQPPESVKLKYPAIVYERANIRNTFADNSVYYQSPMYQLTVIDEDPDSIISIKVSRLPTAKLIQHYYKDNLNHDVFTLYY